MIDGVAVHELKRIPDERGCVMHMLRRDDPHFTQFGEIYFSCVHPGVVKGWHRHRVMGLNYAVVKGLIKLVLHDDREGSPTKGQVDELYVGDQSYCLVQVPPLVWNGFKGCGTETAIVANCATHPHDPEEIERLEPHGSHLPYSWELRHG